MPHQLVAAGAGDPLDQHHIGAVLEHRAVPLPQDVLEVIRGAPPRRVVLAHVAEPTGELREALPIGGFALPLHRQMRRLEELGPGEERDARLADDVHGPGSLE
jgi:hypothetical protein